MRAHHDQVASRSTRDLDDGLGRIADQQLFLELDAGALERRFRNPHRIPSIFVVIAGRTLYAKLDRNRTHQRFVDMQQRTRGMSTRPAANLATNRAARLPDGLPSTA